MRFSAQSLIVIGMSIVALASSARGGETDYEVRFHRPSKVGDRMDVAAVSAMRIEHQYTVAGRERPTREQVYGVEFRAEAEVLEVGPKGTHTKVAFTIRKCVQQVDDREEELIPRSKVVIAEAGKDEAAFRMDDHELPAKQARGLAVLNLMPRLKEATDDEVLGTPQRQRIGNSWPVNVETLLADSKERGILTRKEAISGSVKLQAVEKRDAIDCLRVAGQVKIADYVTDLGDDWNLPQGLELKTCSWENDFTGWLPVDPAHLYQSVSSKNNRAMIFQGRIGRPARDTQLVYKVTRIAELKIMPIK